MIDSGRLSPKKVHNTSEPIRDHMDVKRLDIGGNTIIEISGSSNKVVVVVSLVYGTTFFIEEEAFMYMENLYRAASGVDLMANPSQS